MTDCSTATLPAYPEELSSVESTWQCADCDSKCAACTGPAASECSACQYGYFLKNSTYCTDSTECLATEGSGASTQYFRT